MSRLRRFAEAALEKLDEHNERSQAKALEKLTPAEREHYEAWEARTAHLAATGELQEGKLVGKALQGPAGEALHGVTEVDRASEPLPPGPERDARAAAERAARDAARAPYAAADGRRVRRARFSAAPAERLAATGLAARPDLVYGVYRVPDGNVDEWEVVHAADGPLPPADVPASVSFDARRRWVERRAGQPRPLDEEIALGYLACAGVGPEETLGINRDFTVENREDGGTSRRLAIVRGVSVLHAGAPGPAELGPVDDDVWHERLNWEAIAQAVAPVRREPEPVPSPWPYLPRTSGELLAAYLEVVGVDPADCYGAQVTYGKALDLMGRSHGSGHVRIWSRGRVLGGSQVVVTYRDRPAYAGGRGRWAAYARDVLHAELSRGLSGGEPVPEPESKVLKWADRAYDVANFLDPDHPWTEDLEEPPRYCWPPVG